MLCKAPFLGLTIDPAGWLSLCCATNNRKYFSTQITDIEDLNDFFLGEEYSHIREQMKDEGLGSVSQCVNCRGSLSGKWTEADNYNLKHYEQPLKIRYLELTTSNTCNQTCVTCNSYFSSKWRKIEEQFNRQAFPSYHLKDDSVEKICKVLPDLKYLQIKGGEPFADKNNLKILRELAAVNPSCELIITSNFQNIPDEWYEALFLLKNIKVGASIDGVGKTYDWIRGGNFDDTVANMKKFYDITGIPLIVNICVSLYNISVLNEIYDYFKDADYVDHIISNNMVVQPEYLAIDLMKKSKILELVGDKDDKFSNIRSVVTIDPKEYLIKQFFRHTETMNKIRGFNIFDIQPELYHIFK
jgi:MoaA/NifB/PqqE/SkfB family radical SAM enzyme